MVKEAATRRSKRELLGNNSVVANHNRNLMIFCFFVMMNSSCNNEAYDDSKIEILK